MTVKLAIERPGDLPPCFGNPLQIGKSILAINEIIARNPGERLGRTIVSDTMEGDLTAVQAE